MSCEQPKAWVCSHALYYLHPLMPSYRNIFTNLLFMDIGFDGFCCPAFGSDRVNFHHSSSRVLCFGFVTKTVLITH